MTSNQAFTTYPSLRNAVVLITGGASGIGAAMVESFALQGSHVAFLDLADESALQLVDGLTGRAPHRPVYLHCDLTEIAVLRTSIQEAERHLGPIRVLVSNAANDDRHRFAEVTSEYWDERMNVNLDRKSVV